MVGSHDAYNSFLRDKYNICETRAVSRLVNIEERYTSVKSSTTFPPLKLKRNIDDRNLLKYNMCHKPGDNNTKGRKRFVRDDDILLSGSMYGVTAHLLFEQVIVERN